MATTEAQVRAYLEPEEPNYKAAAADLGADALPVLETLVEGTDPLLASKAAYLASLIPGDHAARVLEQASRSDYPTVRVAAAAGLQKRPDVSDDVAATLMADADEGVRKVATRATRGRTTPTGRDRTGERGPGRRSAGGATPEGTRGPQISEDEHGGGDLPDTNADAEPAAGEGGGDLGGAGFHSTAQSEGIEAESGGGGDLTGAARGEGTRPAGGPDGGGLVGRGHGGDSGVSGHGGGGN